MKKQLPALLLILALLSGCVPHTEEEASGALHVLATTYPVYLFTTSITRDAPGVEVELLVKEQVSCLHDYTLTVTDMKAVERADVIVINGAGLEEFLSDALSLSAAAVIDCSQGIALLPAGGEHGHEGHGEEEYDPHIWLDEANAAVMLGNILRGLAALDEANAGLFEANCGRAQAALEEGKRELGELRSQSLITFHDGFAYFARAHGLTILKAVEEEEGATIPASELREVISLVEAWDVPAIYTEKNGSGAAAKAIARETGVQLGQLDMIMSGGGTGIEAYLDAMGKNCDAILEGLG